MAEQKTITLQIKAFVYAVVLLVAVIFGAVLISSFSDSVSGQAEKLNKLTEEYNGSEEKDMVEYLRKRNRIISKGK